MHEPRVAGAQDVVPQPERSIAPGRKFSISTSASSTSAQDELPVGVVAQVELERRPRLQG